MLLRQLAAVAFVAVVTAPAGGVAAQERASVVIGVDGRTTAGAWTSVVAEVRDAPGARLRVDLDAGGLDRGTVPMRAQRVLPAAGGVQRASFDLPLPRWRSLSWRIEHEGRLLASGSLPTRERDDRPLHLVLGATSPPAPDPDDPEAEPGGDVALRAARVSVADLPERVAGWDGVAGLWIDGSTVAPEPARIVTAAVAGVRVHVRPDAPASYGPLLELVADGPLRIGAGAIVPWTEEVVVRPAEDDAARAWRTTTLAFVADRIDDAPWTHLPRSLLAGAAGGYLLLCWSLLRIGGPSGTAAAGVLVAAALIVAPSAAPERSTEEARATVTVARDGLGVRTELLRLAAQPPGERTLDGIWRADPPRPLSWEDGRTRIPMATGDRVRAFGTPELVEAPSASTDARLLDAEDRSEALAAFAGRPVPAGARLLQRGDDWWWLPFDGGTAVARAPTRTEGAR